MYSCQYMYSINTISAYRTVAQSTPPLFNIASYVLPAVIFHAYLFRHKRIPPDVIITNYYLHITRKLSLLAYNYYV